jgi:hypothetical protein
MTFSFNDLAFLSYRAFVPISIIGGYDFSTGGQETYEPYITGYIYDSGLNLTGGFGWAAYPSLVENYFRTVSADNKEGYPTGDLLTGIVATGFSYSGADYYWASYNRIQNPYIRFVGFENYEGYSGFNITQSGQELTSGQDWLRAPSVISGYSYYYDLPTNYSGMMRWFKSDDYWYLTNGQSVGTATTQLRDNSPFGAHMRFNTLLYPSINITPYSALPAIRIQSGAITGAFTGETAIMRAPFTVFLAYFTTTTGGTAPQRAMNEMMMYGDSGNSNAKNFIVQNYTGGVALASFYTHIGNYGVMSWGATAAENNRENVLKCTAFTFHAPTGASGTLYKIASKVSTTAVGLTGLHFDRYFFNNSGELPTGYFNSIGWTPSTTYAAWVGRFTGYFCEAILYSGEFADSGANLLVNYFKPKWSAK